METPGSYTMNLSKAEKETLKERRDAGAENSSLIQLKYYSYLVFMSPPSSFKLNKLYVRGMNREEARPWFYRDTKTRHRAQTGSTFPEAFYAALSSQIRISFYLCKVAKIELKMAAHYSCPRRLSWLTGSPTWQQ